MPGSTTEQLAHNLHLLAKLNPNVEKIVAHYSVSLHPKEAKQVGRSQIAAISEMMLSELGHGMCPYFGVEHHDAEQKHWHLVASTVAYDGSWVNNSFERYRIRTLEEQLAQRFQLLTSRERAAQRKKHLTTGEYRQKARTGEVLPKEKLWNALDDCIEQGISIERFVLSLRVRYPEISVQFREEGSQKVGISFGIDGAAFAGRRLGKAYSLRGLRAHYGIETVKAESLDRVLALSPKQCQELYADLQSGSAQAQKAAGFDL
ncbi:relaxase/mobilization nuclease domain-containing protein [cf. Phormidesmis sp. LEGE 11477]|uniref:relaxase/mobilization nuclease domain-containing protein n=1 Tax=cf. Phormidesmis sp. LEGE 11477 TaxID=1828680 RepID=UPI0018807208|nr:relaxase/mobilization nuclease domain-containing protein [cf. Phormidesmis sp. LEGE 11477]MBE9062877.1 relaxase/mobilization nuclease domain-containing protein [cf. Phormidesmis sp. LEGE 11477]